MGSGALASINYLAATLSSACSTIDRVMYLGRLDHQVTFVQSHARFVAVPCPTCAAPVGLDCMDMHRRPKAVSARYPVRPHRARRRAASTRGG